MGKSTADEKKGEKTRVESREFYQTKWLLFPLFSMFSLPLLLFDSLSLTLSFHLPLSTSSDQRKELVIREINDQRKSKTIYRLGLPTAYLPTYYYLLTTY
jgi:hypothetical protein